MECVDGPLPVYIKAHAVADVRVRRRMCTSNRRIRTFKAGIPLKENFEFLTNTSEKRLPFECIPLFIAHSSKK